MSTTSHNPFHIDRLLGRDNYATWKFAVEAYFKLEDLWGCIDGTNKDERKETKAHSKLILLLDPINYVHVQSANTCKEVWQCLQQAFDDSGLYRKVALLRDLITTTLENSRDVDDYVTKIMSTAHKLRNIKFNIDDEWLGTLMLAGLPETYKPMIMGLESSGIKINADSIKTKLLQEVQCSESTAFFTRRPAVHENHSTAKVHTHKGPRCFNCNKHGHFAKNCRAPKKKNTSKSEENKSFIAAFSVSSQSMNPDLWYVDSGASMHMTNRCDWMYDVTSPPIPTISVASKTPLPVENMGKVNLLINGNEQTKIQVREVLYIPQLAANLLSVSAIVKNGCKVNFRDKGCDIYDQNNKFLCSATLINNLYQLNTHREVFSNLTCSNDLNNVVLWHRRMGHLNFSDVNKLPEYVEGINPFPVKKSQSLITCTTCLEGKQSRLPFSNIGSRASQPLQLIHTDLCGPMEQVSLGGMKYFITFIDDFTKMVHVYFLKDKLSIIKVFKDYKCKVENELGKSIKIVRSDNGKEYCNKEFDNFLSRHGIEHQTSTPYSPQQNGLAERMNRTLVERAKCMLFDARLPKQLWGEALATAAYIINRSPTKSIDGKTPIEMWTGKKPNLSNMRIFGSEVMAQVPKEKRQKWDAKSRKFVFVGYCESSKGYRLLDLNTNKIIKSRDVVFLENVQKFDNNVYLPCLPQSDPEVKSIKEPCKVELESSSENSSYDDYQSGDNDDSSFIPEESADLSTPARNINLRPRRAVQYAERDEHDVSYFCPIINLSDPQTLDEALSSSHADQWREAMQEEYESLIKNGTWSLVDLPPGKRALPCKWVFKSKTNEKGDIARFKARLVIKGCAQRRGNDYDEVYAPVVRYTSVRYLLALAAKYNLDIFQMDAIGAFLQGDIDTEIYMSQPECYEKNNQVCRLHKSIYGLKQASRQWNLKLNSILIKIGLQRSKIDPCIYFLLNESKMFFIAVWVDDLLIFTNDKKTTIDVKQKLKEELYMKDLGEMQQCIGLNINRNREAGVIMIDQEKYINLVLERFGMSDCKPVRTPIEVNTKFDKKREAENSNFPYREAVGCLIYLAQVTRPDITYAVNKLSQYCNDPGIQHWLGVKRVMRYLQGTKNLKICYVMEDSMDITGYCDADWASDTNDRRSCTGYTFIFQNACISWNSCKQQTVALSTAEAEYMAMASATQEALWLRQLQAELGQGFNSALLIYSDNQSAIRLATTDCYKPKTKHIDIRLHFIRESIVNSKVKFLFVNGCNMVADNLTKGVTLEKHLYCIDKMGLRSGGSVSNN